jgi:hypothetical protein
MELKKLERNEANFLGEEGPRSIELSLTGGGRILPTIYVVRVQASLKEKRPIFWVKRDQGASSFL